MYTTFSNVFDNDNDLCYRIFFAGKLPPTGLRDSSNKAIKYICQPDEKNPFYSTMFDQNQGIAVVAAYSLGPGDVAFQKRKTFSWTLTLGKLIISVRKEDPFLVICNSFSWIEVSSDTLYLPTMPATRYKF